MNAVKTGAWIAVLVVLLAGAGWIAYERGGTPATPRALGPRADLETTATRVAIDPEPGPAPVERTAVVDPQRDSPPEHAPRAGAAVFGRVVGRGGIALARADVAFTWRAPSGPRAVGKVETAHDGTFALALDELSALHARGVSIELDVRASARGYVPARVRRSLGSGEILVRLEPGNVLRGRTVDAAGQVVADAELSLAHAKADANAPLSSTSSGPDGRFELGFVSAGPHVLRARADRVGTALVEALALAADGDRDLGDVVLRGAHTVRGRATHADGAPARGLELWIVASDLGGHATPQTSIARATELERGDGLASSGARTDDDGRFAFEGLRAGSFRVRAADSDVVIRAPETVAAGASDVALTVVTPRVLVRVLDARGAPAPGAHVACVEMLEEGGAFDAGRARHAVARADGHASFAVEPATSYALVARLGSLRSAEDLAILAPGEGQTERTLQLAPESGSAELVVDALGPRGEKVPRLRVELREVLTGRARDDLETLAVPDDGTALRFPAGSYQILVHQAEDPPSLYFPELVATPLVLAPGETRTLAVRLRAGARLGLRLDAENASALDRDVDGVSFVLTREGAADQRAQFVTGSQIVTALLPGESGVLASLVEPGAWTLRASSSTFRAQERAIVLVAGEVTHVDLRVQRE